VRRTRCGGAAVGALWRRCGARCSVAVVFGFHEF